MAGLFTELAIIMVVVFVLSLFMTKVKQPMLIGYIIAGVVVGPLVFNILDSPEGYEAFSHMGVALLLFIVGLHLNVKLVKEVGLVAVLAGLGQVLVTAAVGFFITSLLGYPITVSIIISVGLAFSSTIIVIKLLSDQHSLDKLYGRISVGFLLVQDLIAVFALIIIGALATGNSSTDLTTDLIRTVILGAVAIGAILVMSKIMLGKLLQRVTHIKELLFIFIIAWCFGISLLFDLIGLSIEIGALVAGVALASSKFQHEINSRVRPLRDFFIVMFFVFLGAQLIPGVPVGEGVTLLDRIDYFASTIKPVFLSALLLSAVVLIGKALITFFFVVALGYSSKTGFLAGVTISQISEFSIILVLAAQAGGLIGPKDVSLVTLVSIITITLSAYLISYGERIYKKCEKFLRSFEKKSLKDAKNGVHHKECKIVMFGFNRTGIGLLESLKKSKKPFLVVDHNPDTVKKLEAQEVPVLYGDAGNAEFVSEFKFNKMELVISTVPDFAVNSLILTSAKSVKKDITVVLAATHIDDALELYKQGADYVIVPHFIGGHHVSSLLEEFHVDQARFVKEKITHVDKLTKRKRLTHKHQIVNSY